MTVIDSVDVSDICDSVDEVVICDDDDVGAYRARAFVQDDDLDHAMDEVDVDLTEYPAVIAVARRGLDVDAPIRFDPIPVADVSDDPGLDPSDQP
jgi:hypothetical protein